MTFLVLSQAIAPSTEREALRWAFLTLGVGFLGVVRWVVTRMTARIVELGGKFETVLTRLDEQGTSARAQTLAVEQRVTSQIERVAERVTESNQRTQRVIAEMQVQQTEWLYESKIQLAEMKMHCPLLKSPPPSEEHPK